VTKPETKKDLSTKGIFSHNSNYTNVLNFPIQTNTIPKLNYSALFSEVTKKITPVAEFRYFVIDNTGLLIILYQWYYI
jgi:hypothetical protein